MTSHPPRKAWRSLVAPSVATLIAFAILVFLGMWQLDRKAWKEGLLSAIGSRAFGEAGAPVEEARWPVWNAASDEFRKVRLTGEFLHENEMPLHGIAELRRREPLLGFYLFTPLRRPDGTVVVINRGFVPSELRDPASREAGQVKGPVTVVGLVRAPEERGAFVPANDPSRNEWFVRNLRDMAAARGLERIAPFYVDADATPNPGGWPKGGQTRIALPNKHLEYALTWFGLGASLLGVFGVFAWRRLQAGSGSGDEFQAQNARHDQSDADQAQGRRWVAE